MQSVGVPIQHVWFSLKHSGFDQYTRAGANYSRFSHSTCIFHILKFAKTRLFPSTKQWFSRKHVAENRVYAFNCHKTVLHHATPPKLIQNPCLNAGRGHIGLRCGRQHGRSHRHRRGCRCRPGHGHWRVRGDRNGGLCRAQRAGVVRAGIHGWWMNWRIRH